MELESGAVDAIGMDIGVAKYQIEGREDQFVIMEEPLQSEQYGVGFKLGNTELRDQVQETLLEMVKDGTFAKISEKWFGLRRLATLALIPSNAQTTRAAVPCRPRFLSPHGQLRTIPRLIPLGR